MKAPKKPTRPRKYTHPDKCHLCINGKVKEWEDGPYPSYDWVMCEACRGTRILTADQLNEMANRRYESAMDDWASKIVLHRTLKKIRLSFEEVDAIRRYGFWEFVKDYLEQD